ncbi:putative Uncharacterized Fe-S center protein [uncultured delta proteobacterium]|uniref:Putative Uncharacterized Fe-S center protein n=1 Tax=uncultured delta proteobacterium TaxID=34034 RepID=A0A212K9Q2_9DELT|nr:putative Uncharacterized Fe-S center protein [uncultured delta proteobacterium]
MIGSVHVISFSPCGGTENVMQAITRDIPLPKHEYNITLPGDRTRELRFSRNDLVIMGFPVYGGNMPVHFSSLIAHLKGAGTPLVMVAVYGNREYEGAFLDMHEGVSANGFTPVAAIAAVAQHSGAPRIATGRPDADDREKLAQFGLQALNKAQAGGEGLAAPGAHRAWDLPAGIDIWPNTNMDVCTKCGQCAGVCPMGAVSDDGAATDNGKCIVCAACLKYCPAKARRFGNAETMKEYAAHLAHAVARKEAVLFV